MTRVATLFLWLSSLWAPLQATTLARASLDDLIQKSTLIVHGRVSGSFAMFHGNLIYTHVRIAVLERLKGSIGDSVEVMIPGGSTGTFRQSVPGAPQLADGSEYVFFLWRNKGGNYLLLGLSQGVLDVTKNALGQTTLVRSPIEAAMIDQTTGLATTAERVEMPLSDFRARVAKALGQNRGQ